MCGPLVPLEDGPLVPLENHRLLPRPRGRGPPGCVWDMQVGGWLRADGSKWVKVRNEKHKLEGAVKMAAWYHQTTLHEKRKASFRVQARPLSSVRTGGVSGVLRGVTKAVLVL